MAWTGSVCPHVSQDRTGALCRGKQTLRDVLTDWENFTCSNSVRGTGEATTCPTEYNLHEQQEHIKKIKFASHSLPAQLLASSAHPQPSCHPA